MTRDDMSALGDLPHHKEPCSFGFEYGRGSRRSISSLDMVSHEAKSFDLLSTDCYIDFLESYPNSPNEVLDFEYGPLPDTFTEVGRWEFD